MQIFKCMVAVMLYDWSIIHKKTMEEDEEKKICQLKISFYTNNQKRFLKLFF